MTANYADGVVYFKLALVGVRYYMLFSASSPSSLEEVGKNWGDGTGRFQRCFTVLFVILKSVTATTQERV